MSLFAGKAWQPASTAILSHHLLHGLRLCLLGGLDVHESVLLEHPKKEHLHDLSFVSMRQCIFFCSGTTGLGTQCSLKRPLDCLHPLARFPLLDFPHLSPRCFLDEYTFIWHLIGCSLESLKITAINPHQLTSSSSSGLGARLGPPSLQQNRYSFLLSTYLDVVRYLPLWIFALF